MVLMITDNSGNRLTSEEFIQDISTKIQNMQSMFDDDSVVIPPTERIQLVKNIMTLQTKLENFQSYLDSKNLTQNPPPHTGGKRRRSVKKSTKKSKKVHTGGKRKRSVKKSTKKSKKAHIGGKRRRSVKKSRK